MADEKPISYGEAVARLLAQVDGPIAVKEFVARVLAIRPSKAKKPAAVLRNHLRSEHVGNSLVYLDRETLVPLRIAMEGVRFRIPVTRQQVQRGMLASYPAFHCFLRQDIAPGDVQLVDAAGHLLPVHIVSTEQVFDGLFGPFRYQVPAFDLGQWFAANDIRRNDSVLVTIENWETGRFRLQHEARRRRRQPEIERQNQELADLLFEMLEHARDEEIYTHEAIPTAYARLSEPRGYPGDHWVDVIDRDPRIKWEGFAIVYSDYRGPLERLDSLWFDEQDATLPEEPYMAVQGQQVYRFKAALAYRQAVWRRIDIQGEDTLADFDVVLRDAFDHDPFDHLGGFWKLIPRGAGRRFREVDLGDIDPLGQGTGAGRHIAGLRLTPGDRLKYVYDFGDWIEHLITLEEVVEPSAGVQYPRISGQNEPHYEYCQSCQAEGRQTVAKWLCRDCSYEQEREVLICDRCLEAKHEDHYPERILY